MFDILASPSCKATCKMAPELAHSVLIAQCRRVWCPSTSTFLWLVTSQLECGLGITTLGSVYMAGRRCLMLSTPPSCQLKPCESAYPAWTSATSACSLLTRPPTSSWMSLWRTQMCYLLQSALLTLLYKQHPCLCRDVLHFCLHSGTHTSKTWYRNSCQLLTEQLWVCSCTRQCMYLRGSLLFNCRMAGQIEEGDLVRLRGKWQETMGKIHGASPSPPQVAPE